MSPRILYFLDLWPSTGKSKNDMSIASSTTDAETRAAFKGVKRLITLRNYFAHLGFPICAPTPVFEDNKGTLDLIKKGCQTHCAKHVNVRLCYLHEKHKSGEFIVHECSTDLMLADGLNKALTGPAICRHSYIYTGRRFLPLSTTQHFKDLTRLCPLS